MAIEHMARGYKTAIQLDFEKSFGVAPDSPASVALPVNSFGLNVSRSKNSAQTLTGRRDPVMPYDGNVSTGGDIVVPVDARAFGYWLKLLFGAPATTGSGSKFTHVFKPEDTSPSGIVQCSYGTEPVTYGKYYGCKVSSLEMAVGGDEELTATISMAGKGASFSEDNYNGSPANIVMKRFSNFQAVLTKGGEPFATCTSFSLTIDNGLDTDTRTLGSKGELYDLPEGIMSVTGSVTSLFASLEMLSEAEASNEIALELTLTIDEDNKLTFRFPEVQLQFNTPTVDGPQGVRLEQDFVAYYNDSADNAVCVVTLKNDVASY